MWTVVINDDAVAHKTPNRVLKIVSQHLAEMSKLHDPREYKGACIKPLQGSLWGQYTLKYPYQQGYMNYRCIFELDTIIDGEPVIVWAHTPIETPHVIRVVKIAHRGEVYE